MPIQFPPRQPGFAESLLQGGLQGFQIGDTLQARRQQGEALQLQRDRMGQQQQQFGTLQGYRDKVFQAGEEKQRFEMLSQVTPTLLKSFAAGGDAAARPIYQEIQKMVPGLSEIPYERWNLSKKNPQLLDPNGVPVGEWSQKPDGSGYQWIDYPKQETAFAKPSLPTPKDYTPESIQAWAATRTPENPIGDQSVLVPREKEGAEKSVNTNDVVALSSSRGEDAGVTIPDRVKALEPSGRKQWADAWLAEQRKIQQQNLSLNIGRDARQDEKLALVPDIDARKLDNMAEAVSLMTNLKDAHTKLFQRQGTNLSDTLKSALAKNRGALTFAQVTEIAGTTPEEQEFAATYNDIIANLYKMTDERQLSLQEGLRNMKSFDPFVTPDQFQANVGQRITSRQRERERTIDRLKRQKRDVSPFVEEPRGGSEQPKATHRYNPTTGKVEKIN